MVERHAVGHHRAIAAERAVWGASGEDRRVEDRRVISGIVHMPTVGRRGGLALIETARGWFTALIADRGYDGDIIRTAVQAQGTEVVIPPTRSPKLPLPYNRATGRTRYDKLVHNAMASVLLAAILTYRC